MAGRKRLAQHTAGAGGTLRGLGEAMQRNAVKHFALGLAGVLDDHMDLKIAARGKVKREAADLHFRATDLGGGIAGESTARLQADKADLELRGGHAHQASIASLRSQSEPPVLRRKSGMFASSHGRSA